MGALNSRQQSASPSHTNNNNTIRDSVRESIQSDNHEPHNDDNIFDRNRHNHSQADTVDTASTEDWDKVVERFKSQVLDESYIVYPIRGSTIEAADQYPTSAQNLSLDREYLMPGTHKHLGGAYDPTDGCIYGVPANSRSVMCIYPTTTTGNSNKEEEYLLKNIPLPKEIQDVRMKWLRGIFAHGYLWAIPSWAPKVLCVDVDAYWGRREASVNGIVQLLDLPAEHPRDQIWQWHGAGLNHEATAIYCIPSNAYKVLKVDLTTKTTSLIDVEINKEKYPDLDLNTTTNKWYGGIVGADNAVYGIPYRAGAVLRIDCKTDTAKVVGPNYGCGLYNWHGGVCVNGKIYAHPSHAETVLQIDTNAIDGGTNEPAISELTIHRASYDTDDRKNYKWLGGSVGVDGKTIFCPACDTSAVLHIDTETDHCRTFGFAGKMKNKWQGGVLSKTRDGCIYCIPASGTQILRIPTHPDTGAPNNEVVQLIGDLPVHKDKWQGGYEGKDGCLYFVPENGYRVLKVTPPAKPPKIVNGKLPDNDVEIEFM
ncbi:expressed unknown protein [Seminavis robusta]|uniref:Uncharacterized protein n=1 Tax=Seminavis robusta TaxID=568900 RepID=A0A9N8EBI3_9STRA|nr:expressed unknown protein [Seminavis robusta]|eukprot:Sro926_g221000.1 n/a (538) ;mRNA; f:15370-17104